MIKINFMGMVYVFVLIFIFRAELISQEEHPNIIVIFCDDMGYGDLGVYGHPTIKTPHLDQMAYEGQKWTNFYAAAPVCTPSRAGLLTGRLPIRSGMSSSKRRVLFPDSKGGLPQSEITIAKKLKERGYNTACIGKWHLGHLPEYLPTSHGFDYYYGIPYSNDMDRVTNENYFEVLKNPKVENFNVPLIRNTEIIERPADQTTITKRYTEEAVKYIEANKEDPFFIYLAHSLPHVPLFASEEFEGVSDRGLYGDVIEEIDWSVGQILQALKTNNLEENTLVVFTSDNGPWLIFNGHGGSAGILRGGKGGTYEGGMREPAIFWWPGKIQPGVVSGLGSTLDILPTVCNIVGVDLPKGRVFDGYDLSPVLFENRVSPRNEIFYYRDVDVYAVRKGSYKAHFITQDEYGSKDKTIHNPPLLYNLNHDPAEKYNIANQHGDVIDEIRGLLEEHENSIKPVVNQLER